MKKLILLAGVLVSIAAANIVFGQTTGVITYEVKGEYAPQHSCRERRHESDDS
jgi:hypothetical protein